MVYYSEPLLMDTFYYSALSKTGHQAAGFIQAEDEALARRILNKLGLAILMLSTHEEAVPALPDSERFFFEATVKGGDSLVGGFDAGDIVSAYDRLTGEFEITPAYLISNHATDSEKEEAKRIGVAPILDVKKQHAAEAEAKKQATFSGRLNAFIKKTEEAVTTLPEETPAPAPALAPKPALSLTPPAPAPKPVLTVTPPAPAPSPAPAEETPPPTPARSTLSLTPTPSPAPLPQTPPPAAALAPQPAPTPVLTATPPAPTTPTPQSATTPPPEKPLSALDKLKNMAAQASEKAAATQKPSLPTFVMPTPEEATELTLTFLRSFFGGMTVFLSLALLFCIIASRIDIGDISAISRDLVFRSRLLPYATLSCWALFGVFELSHLFKSQQLAKTAALLLAACTGIFALGVNVV